MGGESLLPRLFPKSGRVVFLGLTAYIGLNLLSPIFGTTTFLGVFLQGFISGMMGILAAILVLHLLKNEELKDIVQTFKTKFWRKSHCSSSGRTLNLYFWAFLLEWFHVFAFQKILICTPNK